MQVQAIALGGLNDAADRFAESAQRTASDPNADLPQELADQAQDSEAFKANAAVLKTADQMAGVLLDIKV